MTRADPFTLDIIRSAMVAAARESFVALGRTSKSPVIYEVLDYACGLTDPEGNLAAQAQGVPGFLGHIVLAVREVLTKYGEDIEEGDVFITNDPYTSGSHLSDVGLCLPIFHRGRIIAWASNRAHWTEVGGAQAGSWSAATTEVYQEGLIFPCLRVYRAGEPEGQLLELIRHNVRLPEMTLGDLHAQVASLRVAKARVRHLIEKYGVAALRASMARHLAHGEALARRALGRLPRGVFEARDFIDDDGITEDPIPVRCRVTIAEDGCTVDFTDSSPQVRGSINCTYPSVLSELRALWMALLDPHAQPNEGWFRPLRVVVPEGTVFNATRPAATSTYWEASSMAQDLAWKALAPHLPDRLGAGHSLSVCGTLISGVDPRSGREFIMVEPQAGGWGASALGDGERGLMVSGDGETYNMPVEVLEQLYPLRVRSWSFNDEPGGQGTFRGGNGLVKELEVLADRVLLTATFGRFRFPPWGLAGGRDGTPNRIEVLRQGQPPLVRGKVAGLELRRGDVIRLITGTGGGYGDPRGRDRRRVEEDLAAGFLTRGEATSTYGWPGGPASEHIK